jgi:hypothetical protein
MLFYLNCWFLLKEYVRFLRLLTLCIVVN